MPLNVEHINEVCNDIIEQQKSGVSTHAMFMMKFNPEGTPAIDKATEQCEKYDLFREKLDAAGAKHGVLVQATMGHIVVPYTPYPFQPSVWLSTGEERVVTACPLDPDFREYMKGQMRILAKRHPSVVMIDDDVGLIYKPTKGCACKYHMAEFNRRAGTNMSREELYLHTQGNSAEDKKYTDIYVDVQRDALVGFVKCMREGLDEIDPKIQGIVSGIYTSTYCEFSGEEARAFAGEGNPAIARMNGGPYAKLGTKSFTQNMFRHAILKENTKDKIDIYLAETDTCPQNRYSTSASHLHAHFTAGILEGATGAKHWITRLGAHEPRSGIAYRKKLAKYAGFYEKLCEYTKELSPFGCRIPLTLMQDYGFVNPKDNLNLSPWSTCVLERLGLPFYFSNADGGAVFVDDFSVDGFSDDEIRGFMKGTLVLSVGATEKLVARGFVDDLGVEVYKWAGKTISGEFVGDKVFTAQYGIKELRVCRDGVEKLSRVVHNNKANGTFEDLFPGVTRFNNTQGGKTVVFSGTPDMPFTYYTAFSMLNETRKKQFVEILSASGNLPVYYPEDAEVYIRAGKLPTGETMVAFFNLGFDDLEDTPLVCADKVSKVEVLNPDGTRSECAFEVVDGVTRVAVSADTLTPVILFLS